MHEEKKLHRRAKGGCAYVTLAQFWDQSDRISNISFRLPRSVTKNKESFWILISSHIINYTGCCKDTMIQPN